MTNTGKGIAIHMNTKYALIKTTVALTVVVALSLQLGPLSPPAYAQFGRMKEAAIKVAACGGGAYAGYRLGEKVAEFEARKLNLGAEEARKHQRAIQIGMALALCGGGALIAGTTFSKLSERDRKTRERELEAAVQESAARTYVLPDHPEMKATATPQPISTEGKQECRMVEDVLADGAQSDRALVKFCRANSGEPWKVQKY
jgi:hypothetical protein